MIRFVFFLEETSAQVMLQEFLPKILPPEIKCRYHPFNGKQDLEKQLLRKLRHYQENGEECKFIILRDQDSADCIKVKAKLKEIAVNANRDDAIICIACRELESWYLADLKAVGMAYNLPNLHEKQKKAKYRFTDSMPSPSNELKKLTGGRYQKQSGSRSIAEHLDLTNQRSASFKHFVEKMLTIAQSKK
jgi:polysaccharide pyruvyl transferase WcaK-like protein